jgi:hypothetical protein|tara:strand:- start:2838 stop:3692 length:855 start_codon:yes stop_codon:yes gene_type:complete
MYFNKDNIQTIDYSKYKKFVAIGCSFTRWRWASWSDCLSQEMPNATYVNAGRAGAGNSYIQILLNQLSRKYNFGDDVLVGIMWSTFYREDKYFKTTPGRGHGWMTPGNIYSQDTYPEEYVKLCDPYHFTMRDCATIDMTLNWLDTVKFDSFSMMGLGLSDQIQMAGDNKDEQEALKELELMYWDLDKSQLPSLHNFNDNGWGETHAYPDTHGTFNDYHPTAVNYQQYLKHCGFPVTDASLTYAKDSTDRMNAMTDTSWQDGDWPWEGSPNYQDELNLYERLLDE